MSGPVPKERQQASEAPFEAKPEMNRTSATKNGSFVDAAELGCKPKNERKGGDSFADGCRVHYGLSSGQDDSSSMSARTKMLHVDTFHNRQPSRRRGLLVFDTPEAKI